MLRLGEVAGLVEEKQKGPKARTPQGADVTIKTEMTSSCCQSLMGRNCRGHAVCLDLEDRRAVCTGKMKEVECFGWGRLPG